MKILLVEDDPIALDVMITSLKRWDYDVITAKTGDEAWEKFQKLNEPVIVILDWVLPGMSGLELCRNISNASRVRETENDYHHPVHIIFVTTRTSSVDAAIALNAGANDFLRKPLELQEFKTRVQIAEHLIKLKIRFEETMGKPYETLDKHREIKILIAEDEPVTHELLTSSLKKWEYDVVAARDGDEAWEKFQALNEAAVIILDWEMPGNSGLEVCRRIMKSEPKHPIQIVFLTAVTEGENVVRAFEAGVNDYLKKPIDIEEFRSRLRLSAQWVDLQRQLRECIRKITEAHKNPEKTG